MKTIWIVLLLLCLPLGAIAAPTAPRLWGNLQPGRYAVGLRVERFDAAPGRTLELVTWYPAARGRKSQAMTFADYLRLAPELLTQQSSEVQALQRSLAVAINSEPEGVASETLNQLLAASLLAVKDAPPSSGKFPLVIWSARHATPAAQCVLGEFIASHGFIVAFVRFTGAPLPLPYQAKDADEKRATLAQHVRDLQSAITQLRRRPQVAADRLTVLTWSYAGESATRLQQLEPRVKLVVSLSSNPLANWVYQSGNDLAALDAKTLNAMYVLLTERVATNGAIRTPPAILNSLPAGSCFAVFPELAHGNFNALEGLIPAVMGITKVQPWSKSGAAAQPGYETAARMTLFFLNAQIKQQTRPSVEAWLRAQKLPDNFVAMECVAKGEMR